MSDHFRVGAWLVQPSLNSISFDGSTTRVEPKVMAVLVCLASRPGEALSKDRLLQEVWRDTFVTEDVLKHAISDLRRVFEDDARDPRVIQTIPKRGYRLVTPVSRVDSFDTPTQAAPVAVPLARNRTNQDRRGLWAAGIAAVVLISLVEVAVWSHRARSEGALPIHSLAVLPLQNLSADPAQEYFSNGMTDALITELAQIGSLKVISRTSSMQYTQTKKSVPEIAHELNVDGIIEGTVQRSGDRVRITAKLIHGPSDKHLWANSYERNLQDVFALERDVADDIAKQVNANLTGGRQAVRKGPRPVAPAALEAYIQGNYHLGERGRGGGDEEMKKAQVYFQQAINLDPSFAPAYIGLAAAHNNLSQGEPEDFVIMRRMAEKSVELDPDSADARVTLGWAKGEDWDWSGAEQEFHRALALDPNSAGAHDNLGQILTTLGRLDEAWQEFQLAQELDPTQDHIADSLYHRGQFDQAIEIRQRIAKKDPLDGYNHYALAMNYVQKGMFKEFALEMGKATDQYGFPEIAGRLQRAYERSGDQGVMRQWAKELERVAATKQLYMPGVMAEVYAFLGEKDRAFYWLEQYRQHHDLATADPVCGYFKSDPWFAPLRSDPRFSDFLRRIGLPP